MATTQQHTARSSALEISNVPVLQHPLTLETPRVTKAKAKKVAATPVVQSRFGFNHECSDDSGVNRLDGIIAARTKDRGHEVTANIDLRRSCDKQPRLWMHGEGSDTRWDMEDVPGDVRSLNVMIDLLVALRDTMERELPAMLKQESEYNAYISRFPTPREMDEAWAE